jgi:cysteine desulfurase
VDAVQVLGQAPIRWSRLPVDLLSGAAHKLQGPRGIGLLLARRGLALEPLLGGAQERGRRGGTEPVPLVAGFATALGLRAERLAAHGGTDPIARMRDNLWAELASMSGLELLGPPPGDRGRRLPHHLSVLARDPRGRPLSGRALVRALAQLGVACGSGSACSARAPGGGGGRGVAGASRVLLAMGYGPEEASAGLRLSLGPWLREGDLAMVPDALARAMETVARAR